MSNKESELPDITVFEKIIENHKQVSNEPHCPCCNTIAEMVWVHGHYQCPNCKRVVVSCCGDS